MKGLTHVSRDCIYEVRSPERGDGDPTRREVRGLAGIERLVGGAGEWRARARDERCWTVNEYWRVCMDGVSVCELLWEAKPSRKVGVMPTGMDGTHMRTAVRRRLPPKEGARRWSQSSLSLLGASRREERGIGGNGGRGNGAARSKSSHARSATVFTCALPSACLSPSWWVSPKRAFSSQGVDDLDKPHDAFCVSARASRRAALSQKAGARPGRPVVAITIISSSRYLSHTDIASVIRTKMRCRPTGDAWAPCQDDSIIRRRHTNV